MVQDYGRPSEALTIENPLSSGMARVPSGIERSSGVVLQGRRLRSFAYSTDVAVIRNTNADAILAVYPFTGQPVITQALITVAQAPVFVGVGGGTTTGARVIELAVFAEMQGVSGVVLNAPAPPQTVQEVAMSVNIPVMATVIDFNDDVKRKIEAGARIINVAAGKRTAEVVYEIKQRYPEIPLVASSGGSETSIRQTIEAGANALSWTPPSAQDLQKSMMASYRAGQGPHGAEASPADPISTETAANFEQPQDTPSGTHHPRHKKESSLIVPEERREV
ncbi:dioxygenase [Bifidobacterium bombi]|uniref:Dioxygenase n=1 Tax=Bifidobacterium bombi DSM 19703 TaxID=1341695 RepID=A0A080N448_9BIFI|nr:dioxygenase [Bifidobacterium bombi]KFF31035.1 hypothetical protein BBOMB_0365 [Bifidobacterium bombi DSM 19703]